MTLEDAAKNIFNINMGLKSKEHCLIIFDESCQKIAATLEIVALTITSEVLVVEIPVSSAHGTEPSDEISELMSKNDVILIVTTKSLSHTNARKYACMAGARIASMPGITEEIMLRTLVGVDYREIDLLTQKYNNIFGGSKSVRVVTSLGTDITFDLNLADLKPEGLFVESKLWGNLPAGESCYAPVEGTANGKFVVDASMSGLGKIDTPITFVVENGKVVLISGGIQADELKDFLRNLNDPSVYNIAELGIGTNNGAVVTGNVLEDEKVLGTAHIAIGDNTSYPGGNTNSSCHLDGVFFEPTIFINNKVIIKDGKLIGD